MPTTPSTAPLVLYVYSCTACGHSGSVHLVELSPEVINACSQCGAEVVAEWDGGVDLRPTDAE